VCVGPRLLLPPALGAFLLPLRAPGWHLLVAARCVAPLPCCLHGLRTSLLVACCAVCRSLVRSPPPAQRARQHSLWRVCTLGCVSAAVHLACILLCTVFGVAGLRAPGLFALAWLQLFFCSAPAHRPFFVAFSQPPFAPQPSPLQALRSRKKTFPSTPKKSLHFILPSYTV
jgi:hypothetical protein